jgi:hypothetical protein
MSDTLTFDEKKSYLNDFEEKIFNIDLQLEVCKLEMNSIYGLSIRCDSAKLWELINQLKLEKHHLLIRYERKRKLDKINTFRLNYK